jgi:hypothetical protein
MRFMRRPADAAPAAHGPQQTFLAVDKQDARAYTRFVRPARGDPEEGPCARRQESAYGTGDDPAPRVARRRPHGARPSRGQRARLQLGRRRHLVRKDELRSRNTHVLALPGANDFDQCETVGSVIYFRPVVENDGTVRLDTAGFEKLVAVAEGSG